MVVIRIARRRWGHLAAAWAVLFALAHFYWALGGRVGLDVSAGSGLSTDRPAWFVLGGLVGVGVALLGAAAVALALVHTSVLPRLLRVLCWTTAVVLLVRGVGLGIVLATGVVGAGDGISPEQIAWTWALWNPWFVLGGLCFALAARSGRPGTRA